MAFLLNKILGIHYEFAEEAVLGRSDKCSLRMNYPTISKQHAKVFRGDGGWYAEDLGSANLTYINGEKISRVRLNSGDYIRLDVHTLVFFADKVPQLPELTVYEGIVLRQKLPITKSLLRIGRRLDGNHIVLDDQDVGSQHLELKREGKRWVIGLAHPHLEVQVNEHPASEGTTVGSSDRIKIGSMVLEISVGTLKESQEVARVCTRLEETYRLLRMQVRTLEEVIQENFPVVKGSHEWSKKFLEIFNMVDRSLKELQQVFEIIRQMVPSMENLVSDRVLTDQSLSWARRCNNLANYLEAILNDNQLLNVQNADLAEQKTLIEKLYEDVKGCLETDNPTLRLI